MSRENSRKYPRSVESKNSFLRIRAPENLDIALEGLIRKVLKEQPKMDDIYAFAADYFDMLLKIREKAGIRKLSAQDICPYHNEDDAHEMVKLASSFTKRTKPHSNTCKAFTSRNQDQSKNRKGSGKLEPKDLDATNKQDRGSEIFENKVSLVKENTESEKAKHDSTESESTENETAYSIKVSGQEIGEEIFIRANEVVTEYNAEDEDSPRDISGNGAEAVGDINELRDKIRAVENEIKRLDNKENKSEGEIVNEGIAAEGLEKRIDETGNSNQNDEEGKSERRAEDVKTMATETEVEENSVEAKSQEEDQEVTPDTVEKSGDSNVNAENAYALDEKLEEQEDVKTNTEIEGSPQPEVETELKVVAPAAPDVNTDTVKIVDETEEIGGKTRPEAEEVQPIGDDAQKVEEMSPQKQTENKETGTENVITEMFGQDESLQEKEKEIIGEENLNSENMEKQTPGEGDREATNVQDSEVTDTEAPKGEDVNKNLEVREMDPSDPGKTSEETEKIEKEPVDGEKRDIDVTGAVVPVLIASALNGTEKIVEGSIEKSSAAEKVLLTGVTEDPNMSVAAEIENFLDKEREFSSNEKEAEDRESTAITDGNPDESKIASRGVFELGTIKENEELVIPRDDASGKASGITQEPDDFEPDNQEGSTTSDEIEFDASPANYPETEILVTTASDSTENDETIKETKAEPEIIVESNTEDKEGEDLAKECKKEPNKALLEVPELTLDENIVRSEDKPMERGSAVAEPEDERVSICGNIGNEIIQTGEVEKVELVEGEEDILQVHLTATIETEQDPRDSIHVEMTSKIDPDFKVSVETKLESPVQNGENAEKMQLIRAAVIIQNGFRRFKSKKTPDERKQDDKHPDNGDASKSTENGSTALVHAITDSRGDSDPSLEEGTKTTGNPNEKRKVVESQSLDSVRKISPLKTRSLSSVRQGAEDFEVWNQLVKELEEAATKIQSNYRGYKSRKKLQRGNAVQSTTTTSEDSTSMPDPEINHRHTGEFHDSLVLSLDPK